MLQGTVSGAISKCNRLGDFVAKTVMMKTFVSVIAATMNDAAILLYDARVGQVKRLR